MTSKKYYKFGDIIFITFKTLLMKRILLILTMISISVSAQMSEKLKVVNQKKSIQQEKLIKPSFTSSSKSDPFWSDDFSDPSNWVIEHDATACNLDWEIGVGLSTGGSFGISSIESTTASNGFAMVDSDEYGGEEGGSDVEDSWFTTANPIDLSSAESALLQFETWYRSYNSEQCFVVISTTNDDWPELTPEFDASTNPNVFSVFPNYGSGDQPDSNPELKGINISDIAANESQVWVRFHWTGTWGYAWFIDDVSIIEMPSDEIILNYGYFSMGGSEEYGRTPESQMNDTITLGGEVYNFGANDQSNVTIDASITNSSGTVLAVNTVQDVLENDSTAYIQDLVTNFAPLAVGNYNLSVSVSSDGDNSNGENYANNSYSRSFEITENLYSLDGIGVYDDESLAISVLASNSFTDNEDGLIIMVYYVIREQVRVNGLEVALSNADSYSAGAEIVPFLLTLDAWNADEVFDRMVEGDFITVEDWNLDQGKIWLPFDETVLEPGSYFACVELYSGSGDNHVGILDDETVAQPGYATEIYTPSDQSVYTNGTAAAVRMGIENYVSIEENTIENLVSISPNPSNGVFTLTSNTSDIKTIEVVNILGEVIDFRTVNGTINETFDMTSFSAGMYFVKSSNGTSESTQRIIIK